MQTREALSFTCKARSRRASVMWVVVGFASQLQTSLNIMSVFVGFVTRSFLALWLTHKTHSARQAQSEAYKGKRRGGGGRIIHVFMMCLVTAWYGLSLTVIGRLGLEGQSMLAGPEQQE